MHWTLDVPFLSENDAFGVDLMFSYSPKLDSAFLASELNFNFTISVQRIFAEILKLLF